MRSEMCPGTVLDDTHRPYLVMTDEVGVFVFVVGERFRHYCLHEASARELAEHLSKPART